MLPEVFLKAVSVVRNFGHSLDGLVTVNVDKESHYRSTVNVLNRPADGGHRADRAITRSCCRCCTRPSPSAGDDRRPRRSSGGVITAEHSA